MTSWISPSKNKQLYLPISDSKGIDELNLSLVSDSIFVSVDAIFIDIWENGAKSNSCKDLHDALVILGKTFIKLAKKGQGLGKIYTKSADYDLVTQIDIGIEWLFRNWIRRFFPTHKIVGEEGIKDTFSIEDIVWFVDPIDGTNNFVKGLDTVTMHFGALKAGIPYVTFIGLPIQNNYFSSYEGLDGYIENDIFKTFDTSKISEQKIGTEFFEHRLNEANALEKISTLLNLESQQYKSIGLNLISLIQHKLITFYKPGIKLWDALAPLILLHLATDAFNTEIFYSSGSFFIESKKAITHDLFIKSQKFVDHINTQQKSNCRAGLIITYPKSQPEIKTTILQILKENL